MNRSELKQQAKNMLRGNWWMGAFFSLLLFVTLFGCMFIGGFILVIVTEGIAMFNGAAGSTVDLARVLGLALGMIFGLLCWIPFGAGWNFVMLEWAETGRRPKQWFSLYMTAFKKGYFWLTIRVMLLVMIWTILWKGLFIPLGYVKQCAYSQALLIMRQHIQAGDKVTARQCITESRQLMNGWKEDFFILDLSFMNWTLPALIVGVLCFSFLRAINRVFLLWSSTTIPAMSAYIVILALMLFIMLYQRLTQIIFYLQLKRQAMATMATVPVTIYPDGQTEFHGNQGYQRPSNTLLWFLGIGTNVIVIGGIFLALFLCWLTPNLRGTIAGNEYRVTIKGEIYGFDYTGHARIIFHTSNALQSSGDNGQTFAFTPVDNHHDIQQWNKDVIDFLDNPAKYQKYVVDPKHNEVILYDNDGNRAFEFRHVRRSNNGKTLTGQWYVNSNDETYHAKFEKIN